MLPIHLGSAEDFAAVREFLRASGYTYEAISQYLGTDAPYDFTVARPDPDPAPVRNAVDLLGRLFLKGELVTAASMAQFVPAAVRQSMERLGLCWPATGGCFVSPVVLYELHSVYMTSDRWSEPGNPNYQIPSDAVFPAMTATSQRFLQSLGEDPCTEALDLCTGCGAAALLLAGKCAAHVWASDVTERAIHFTEFNCHLNGLSNVTLAQGDLFDAVPGLTFDRITAHPPYVPVLGPKWIYHDGGVDGEQITRRIFEALPQVLRPGGTFQAYAMGTDRDLPYERRLRRWLGSAEGEFDIVLVEAKESSPTGFAADAALKSGIATDYEAMKQSFAELGIERLVSFCITIQRHAAECPALTLRRKGSASSEAAEGTWLLRWHRLAASPEMPEFLMNARPRLSPDLNLAIIHGVVERRLQAVNARAATLYPYTSEVVIDPRTAALLAACDGRTSGRELLQRMQAEGNIPVDTSAEQFAGVMANMVSYGFVYLEEHAPPKLRKI